MLAEVFFSMGLLAQAQPPANIKLLGLGLGAIPTTIRVTRVPGVSEVPAEFYGVDYPGTSVPSISTTGFLILTDGTTWIAVWAPGQWARIEKIN